MYADSLTGLHIVGYLACLAAVAYGVVALIATALWRGRPVAAGSTYAPVTILKPLCGMETDLYANLRSFCQQRYPDYQIVFGVQDAGDPALAVVQRLQQEFPAVDITIAIDNGQRACNPKIENLMGMIGAARHEYLVIADSDIHVGRDYLSHVCAPLADPQVGMVTCLYRARPVSGFWSQLNGLFIDDWFVPSVLVTRMFRSQAFVFGATIALRRSTLIAIGNFSAIANYLADDYRLGELVRRAGLRTVLSSYVVDTLVDEPSFKALVAHEIRWLRTLRALRPLAYPFIFMTCTLPLALVGVVLTWGQIPALISFVCVLALRFGLRCLEARQAGARRALWLLPVRDALTVYIWFSGLGNPHIRWRSQQYRIARSGLLRRISRRTARRSWR